MKRIQDQKQVAINSVQNFDNIKTQKKNHQTLLNATKTEFEKQYFSSKGKIK
jgi:hypothetical protein